MSLAVQTLALNVFLTCGMYPIRGPGTPLPRLPGVPPNTQISPEFNRLRPTIHDKSVVFPQPEAPSKP